MSREDRRADGSPDRSGGAAAVAETEPTARTPARARASGWGVALVVASDLRAAEQATRDQFPGTHIQPVVKGRVPHLVVRIPLPTADQWPIVRKSLGRLTATSGWSALTVCPRAGQDSEDVERRRARAQELLPLLAKLPIPRPVVDVDELLAFDVLSVVDAETQRAVVRRILGPVLDQPGGIARRQLATLEALHWHDGSVKSAAKALGVHTKTVHNRLRRLEQATGLWLDHPPDRLRIDLALYLLRASEAGLGQAG